MFCLITIIIITIVGHNNNMHEKIVVMSYIKTQEQQQQHNFITLYGKIMTKVFGNSCDYINGANQLNSSSSTTTSNEAGKLQYLFIFYDQQIVTQIT